jgi:hypothetical protein
LQRRFVKFILPVGYIRGELRTAELGLLFKVFGPSAYRGSSAGSHVSASWNQIWQEIQAFVEFVREWRAEHERLKEAVRTGS